jgi:DNA-binding CsgD family transcriptional regulator/tetratricopeptide (TPR) repeat protein
MLQHASRAPSADRFLRRRRAARDRGICIVCFKTPAPHGRAVCLDCNDAAKQRVRESRRRKSVAAERRRLLSFHESAADIACARYDYPEALLRYDEALKGSSIGFEDELRLSPTYANVLFFGREPENARGWLAGALNGYRSAGITPSNAVAAGTLLLQVARQCWLNTDTVSALPLIGEAIQLGTLANNRAFSERANLAMAHYLILLGRHEAAEPFFERAGNVLHSELPETRAVSLTQRAILFAAKGSKAEAYAHFEAAVAAAKALPDGYQITSIWDDYGIWAMALGDIATAQLCREQALFVARDRHIAWRIAYLSLRYADLLIELEQYDNARDLVLDALALDIATPCVVVLLATVGLKLSYAVDDEGLRRRCTNARAVDYALQSGEPGRIGPLLSAAVRWHIARDESSAAKSLLRRGLTSLLNADHAWDLLLDAARYGTQADRRHARTLLTARAYLPNNRVAAAYLKSFDGDHAGASRDFASIGWRAHATKGRPASPGPTFRTLLGDMTSLTKREEEVAQLALKGLTNRAIARELAISEHTVESHMTSIMNRLGIRSRHQLTNSLAVGDSRMTPSM